MKATTAWSVNTAAATTTGNGRALPAGAPVHHRTAAPATITSPAGRGNDALLGGDGNDCDQSAAAATTSALIGDGNDTFVWNPGDGSDIVEGQGGTRHPAFNGANANEKIDISANGTRVRLSRDVAAHHDGPE